MRIESFPNIGPSVFFIPVKLLSKLAGENVFLNSRDYGTQQSWPESWIMWPQHAGRGQILRPQSPMGLRNTKKRIVDVTEVCI